MPRRLRNALVYVGWIALCVILFVAMEQREDPSRRSDRILSNDAGVRAEAILHRTPAFSDYRAVHVAYASAKEGEPEARWVVLLDRQPHGGLATARVVELRAADGSLLRIRAPQ